MQSRDVTGGANRGTGTSGRRLHARGFPTLWITVLGVAVGWLALLDPPVAVAEVVKRQIGQMVLEDVPEPDPAVRERMLQYLAVRPTALTAVREDGKAILISTRFGDTNQVHLVSQPMGARKQITFFDEPVNGAAWIPGTHGARLIYVKDVGGNENYQFSTLDLTTGRSALLTDGKSRNQGLSIARNGQRIAFASNLRNGRDFDIYVDELSGGEPPRLAWKVEGSYGPGSFSPDAQRLFVQHYVSERETHWYVLDVASGQTQRFTPEGDPFYYGGGEWSPDGRYAYFTTDREGQFRKLYQVDLEYNQWKCLTADIDWDIEDVAVEPTGKGLAFCVNEDGYTRLYFADADGGNRRPIDGLERGVIGGLTFAHQGGVLGLTLNTARLPADAYTVSYPDGKVTRWTESEVGGLDSSQFVDAELIRYPTFDQVDGKPRTISAFVYRGQGQGKRPVVIYPHGGPEGQSMATFSAIFQYWAVEMGISIIAPNVRGSTGYGRAFHQLDNGVLREDSVKDIGALLDWIARQPDLDSTRVGIYGGSYGGYMVLASLVNYPGRIKAGIDVVGIADFISFLTNTAEYRRDLRRAEYGDERDPAVRQVLEAISPLRNADKIQAALFVAHGENDPRVPVSEARQIVAKMRALNRPVWFAAALDEGHGFRKKPNRDLAAVLYTAFWSEHLLK
jgi:dipeptidyl aminopeptidase/acylaminoacyl peptidase